MTPIQQLMLGVGASKKTYLDDVFSTYVYEGTGSARSINNGINLSGKGGMTWIKSREETEWHHLFDTVRGAGKGVFSNSNVAEITDTTRLSSFNNNGFSLGTEYRVNKNDIDFSSWTFRKAPGFFDVVTWTGDNSSSRQISHNLGSVPGMIIIKKYDGSGEWRIWHKDRSTKIFKFTTHAEDYASSYIQSTPTSTQFEIGNNPEVNGNGDNFIAYVFAGGESTASEAVSVDFDGSGDYLSLASDTDLHFGSGDYTVECWAYIDDQTDPSGIWTADSHQDGCELFVSDDGKIGLYSHGGYIIQTAAGFITKGQWYHLAVTRASNTARLFVNGTLAGSATQNSLEDGPFFIGAEVSNTGSLGWPMRGKISNFRVVKGTALYTSSFRPPTEPLTNVTNTKLLCCNNSSTTGSTVTPGTITANGDPTASTDSPFDDPAGFVFGDAGDQNVIKCGSYVGNGSADGPEIFLGNGWEPQWVMIKNTESAESWAIYDSMRGIVSGGNDPGLYANTTNSEYSANIIDLTSTGFKLVSSAGDVNENNKNFIYVCIRRSDGYVGKPADAGTDVFAMDTGSSSTTIPNFDSGFPVDFALRKNKTGNTDWITAARLSGTQYLIPNSNSAQSSTNTWFTWDSNLGWATDGTNHNSWMWKRHAGFDVVTFRGNSTNRTLAHSLNKIPEMMWLKNRTQTGTWNVYHKGLNGGTNPEQSYIQLDDQAQNSSGSTRWNNTAPTSTHFTLGTNGSVNDGNEDMIAMLFSSVSGISKVGYYDGSGGSNTQTITTGFQPRFLIVKCVTHSSTPWYVFDTTRGWASGGYGDFTLQLNSNAAQANPNNDWSNPISTGFTVSGNGININSGSQKFIYYAHA